MGGDHPLSLTYFRHNRSFFPVIPSKKGREGDNATLPPFNSDRPAGASGGLSEDLLLGILLSGKDRPLLKPFRGFSSFGSLASLFRSCSHSNLKARDLKTAGKKGFQSSPPIPEKTGWGDSWFEVKDSRSEGDYRDLKLFKKKKFKAYKSYKSP